MSVSAPTFRQFVQAEYDFLTLSLSFVKEKPTKHFCADKTLQTIQDGLTDYDGILDNQTDLSVAKIARNIFNSYTKGYYSLGNTCRVICEFFLGFIIETEIVKIKKCYAQIQEKLPKFDSRHDRIKEMIAALVPNEEHTELSFYQKYLSPNHLTVRELDQIFTEEFRTILKNTNSDNQWPMAGNIFQIQKFFRLIDPVKILKLLSTFSVTDQFEVTTRLVAVLKDTTLTFEEFASLFETIEEEKKMEYLLTSTSKECQQIFQNKKIVVFASAQSFFKLLTTIGSNGRQFFRKHSEQILNSPLIKLETKTPEFMYTEWVLDSYRTKKGLDILEFMFRDSSIDPSIQSCAAEYILYNGYFELDHYPSERNFSLTAFKEELYKISSLESMKHYFSHLEELRPSWIPVDTWKIIVADTSAYPLLISWNKIPPEERPSVIEQAKLLYIPAPPPSLESYYQILDLLTSCDPEARNKSVAITARLVKLLAAAKNQLKPQPAELCLRLLRIVLSKKDLSEDCDLWSLEKEIEDDLLSPEKLPSLTNYEDLQDRLCLLLAIQETNPERQQQTLIPLLTKSISRGTGRWAKTLYDVGIAKSSEVQNLREAIMLAQEILPILQGNCMKILLDSV